MALYSREFFMEQLKLPFTDAAVVGNTYYATPIPGGPLRLRIDFARTIRADEYDGLRLATIHRDRGELDAAVLRFEDHKTFDHRDATLGRSPQPAARSPQPAARSPRDSGYGTIYEFRDRPDWMPWEGAHTGGIRDAIEQYASVWFPGAWQTTAPSRAPSPTARKAPTPPATRSGSRAR